MNQYPPPNTTYTAEAAEQAGILISPFFASSACFAVIAVICRF